MINSLKASQVPLKLFSLNENSKEGSRNQVILKDKTFKTSFEKTFSYRGVDSQRLTNQNDLVDVYRNLNKKDYFSCKQRKGEFKGKVTLYAKVIILKNPTFSISESSRQRVLNKKVKNVHSFLRAEFYSASDNTSLVDVEGVTACTYNPYFSGYFFNCESKKEVTNEEVKKYKFAVLFGSNVYLYKEYPEWAA